MVRRILSLFVLVLMASSAAAQQSIYWKKDHIYNGPGGKEVAIATPVPSDTTAPTAPSGLSSSNLTATSVQLSWTGSTDSGGSNLAGYKIYRQIGTGANLPVGTVGTGTLSFTDQPLQPSTGYNYTIVAFDNAQNHSSASGAVSVTTSSAASDTTAPTVPANLAASVSSRNSVKLAWSPSTDVGGTGVAGYKVYRDGNLISGASPINALQYQDNSLSYKTAYAYTVTAVDNSSNASSASSAANVTTDWQLALQDDFARINGSIGNGWSAIQGPAWEVKDTKAYRYRAAGGSGTSYDAVSISSQSSFRATADIVSSSGIQGVGLFFWESGSGLGGPHYRAEIVSSTLNLRTEAGTITTASVSSTGTLRVEANSSSRNIKIYFNGTLKIDYTETNTSRPNTGRTGMFVAMPNSSNSWVYLDNYLLEN